MEIAGSRVVVTGATGGIGRAVARDLATRGARLVLTARRAEPLRALAEEIGAEVVVADLASRDGLGPLLSACAGADVLVANAAVAGRPSPAADPVEHIDEVLDVNLRAPLVLADHFATAHVEASRPGQIVLVGSLAGVVASAPLELYCASKFGLRGYGLGLRQALAGDGIGVTVVAPGVVRDVGMSLAGGRRRPPGLRTVTAEQVAAAVARAIRSDPAEIFVAPAEQRVAAAVAAAFPGVSAFVQKRIGLERRMERRPR